MNIMFNIMDKIWRDEAVSLHRYLSLDAVGMAQLVQKKEVSPKELVDLSIAQHEKVHPKLNITTHTRFEQAQSEADGLAIDRHPFAGVPFLLKDASQALAGEPLTTGAKLTKNFISEQDSYFVKKLGQAGLIITGHTTTPEFALKNITESELYGPTRNPWNTNYSPGGSSGGAAAAVASGVVPVAGASDGGGSIRIPASFSGLFGLKPTRGRTPVGPGVGRQWHGAAIDFVLSRSVRDSAALLDVLEVVQPEAAFQAPPFGKSYLEEMKHSFKKPLRIAFTTESPVGTPVSEEAEQAVHKTVKWLEEQGHHVEEQKNDVDGIELMRNYFLMNSGEVATVMMQMEEMMGRSLTADDVEIETWLLNVAGRSVSAAQFSASLSSWDVAAEQMARFHETYDFYITPSASFTAPEIGELTYTTGEQDLFREKIQSIDPSKQQELIYEMFLPSLTYTPFTQLANLTGQPAMSLPVHLASDGLPIGVHVMANKGSEYSLLKLAYAIEQSDLWVGMNGNPFFTTNE